MIVTLERLSELLDEIAQGRRKPVSVRQLAEETKQPTTLVRQRALERGLTIEHDTVYLRSSRTPR